ncbi:uncharacterized protein MONOS_16714 [Monocercomonoides exilis]|uniref:uncharacterized protein n=1 Tax=Monocercomonoides exilis TaxID=2049356 RepID=UPI00355A418F|nr:hypothetical protein MONOS_16714 [Monocercomonoides exilis]|eukprot:MONOS_16714.1-p1 / transcript=MONOS_16714.1 / gene=MONOS_16714 / organism=Monocercomonoides_exilis_PA203 / gene_product=unspecified product / transcript_product=unspecified product / location=Mono_scaffold02054:1552-2059(-) / protein_length=83 / sequence_SO=supercontig / SO=protein_coding / is_pseudo=false
MIETVAFFFNVKVLSQRVVANAMRRGIQLFVGWRQQWKSKKDTDNILTWLFLTKQMRQLNMLVSELRAENRWCGVGVRPFGW